MSMEPHQWYAGRPSRQAEAHLRPVQEQREQAPDQRPRDGQAHRGAEPNANGRVMDDARRGEQRHRGSQAAQQRAGDENGEVLQERLDRPVAVCLPARERDRDEARQH